MCFLQDDIVKFVSEPASPPRLVEILDEGKGKAKERREVGEGDDTVVVEGRLHLVPPDQFIGGDVQTYYEQGYNYQDHQYQPPAED
jgi:hypothetical protein